MSRQDGFTLLEIMLALLIGLLLMAIAVPSISGMMKDQKLRETFTEFDDFVRKAQVKAVTDRLTYVMVWDETGISLRALDPSAEVGATDPEAEAKAREAGEPGDTDEGDRFTFAEGTTWSLVRPAALVKKPVWEWPFWRSGACEPVIVSYVSPAGTWSAEYNGLTARGKVVDMEVK